MIVKNIKLNSKIAALFVGGVLVVAFAWLVWPTPYQYFKSGRINERSNRITGRVQFLTTSGWRLNTSKGSNQVTPVVSQAFTENDLAAIKSNSTIIVNTNSITLWIHNPTSRTIHGATLRLGFLPSNFHALSSTSSISSGEHPYIPMAAKQAAVEAYHEKQIAHKPTQQKIQEEVGVRRQPRDYVLSGAIPPKSDGQFTCEHSPDFDGTNIFDSSVIAASY